MIGVTVLGSTGSIGLSTLDVISQHSDKYRVVALTARKQVERLFQQCQQFRPQYAVMVDENAATQLEQRLKTAGISDITVLQGIAGLEKVASLDEVQQVMAAIVGAAGLRPTLSAARSGKRVLLANKEALVLSGQILIDEVKKNGAELLPIDSEHNAIFQCMPVNYHGDLRAQGVTKILLTASGGPFRTRSLAELHDVTPDQACAHPNWDMGRKISVDSASMMNKGLEVIEARWLFNASADDIQVVVHPQSVIHSMVQYADGSVLAQLGNPDMRTPIAHAMAWPERHTSGVAPLNLFEIARLDFETPDFERFPCLRLSYDALRRGGTATAILNAANEIAVEAFLEEKISFTSIPQIIEHTLEQVSIHDAQELAVILGDDEAARSIATEKVEEIKR
ncbi:MAG: 1-deoxy-D-xylulose-5-phosphate reductoisomerase [Gammaproteobacteria bacterium]|nr:1-deoxy-D-xylulose-5-phosphate reductoisomerase [Gammaproteobacteria bacterium]